MVWTIQPTVRSTPLVSKSVALVAHNSAVREEGGRKERNKSSE